MSTLDRERLGALADVLIPAAAGMPSATQAGVHREGLDRVLAARPDLEPVLARVLAAADGEPGDVLRGLQASDEAGFAALALAVTGGYYTDPEIRRLIGYPGQQYQPELVTGAPDWDEAALARVVERGAIYRSTGTVARGKSFGSSSVSPARWVITCGPKVAFDAFAAAGSCGRARSAQRAVQSDDEGSTNVRGTTDRRPRPRRVRRRVELERRDHAAAGRAYLYGARQPAARHSPDSAYIASVSTRSRPGPRRRPLLRRRGDHERRDRAKNVVGLVYVAAFAPDEGERWANRGDVEGRHPRPPAGCHGTTPPGTAVGDRSSDRPRRFRDAFAADLPPRSPRSWRRPSGPSAELAFSETTGAPAWKDLPAWAVVATGDKAAGTDLADRWPSGPGATITEIEGSHVIMVSQPQAVTDVILAAVAAVGSVRVGV